MAHKRHVLETMNAVWVFEPRGDNVEISSTAFTGELGIQGAFSKEEARQLWKELRSDGALWENKDCAEI